VNILSACGDLQTGKELHELIGFLGYEFDPTVANAIVGMYAKCGYLEGAKRAFNNGMIHNAISWTFLVAAYSRNGQEEEALKLFGKIKDEGIISEKVTYEDVLAAFDQGILANDARLRLLGLDEKCGVMPGAESFSNLVDLLGTSGRLDEAEKFVYTVPYEPPNAVYSVLTEENKFQFDFKLPLF
jgi:pentatricopeptide repeat protein